MQPCVLDLHACGAAGCAAQHSGGGIARRGRVSFANIHGGLRNDLSSGEGGPQRSGNRMLSRGAARHSPQWKANWPGLASYDRAAPDSPESAEVTGCDQEMWWL